MKTFKQFILEDRADYSKAFELIRRDCGPFLEASKGKLMYRGVRGLNLDNRHVDENGVQYFKKTVRQDRLPLSTSKHIHELVDDYFGSEFRWYPRSTSMFAVGERGRDTVASSYGTPCIVFPIGEIQFLWSSKVSDLFDDLGRDIEGPRGTKEFDEAVVKYLEDANYTDMDLDKALETRNEIMVKCDSYYAFPAQVGSLNDQDHRREEFKKAFT